MMLSEKSRHKGTYEIPVQADQPVTMEISTAWTRGEGRGERCARELPGVLAAVQTLTEVLVAQRHTLIRASHYITKICALHCTVWIYLSWKKGSMAQAEMRDQSPQLPPIP